MLCNGYLSNMQPDLLQVDGTLTYDPLFANCGRAHTLCGSTLLGGGLGSYVRVGPCVAMTAAVEIASAWLANQELVNLGYQAAGMIVKDKTCLSEEQPSWFILESNATLLDVSLEKSPEKNAMREDSQGGLQSIFHLIAEHARNLPHRQGHHPPSPSWAESGNQGAP